MASDEAVVSKCEVIIRNNLVAYRVKICNFEYLYLPYNLKCFSVGPISHFLPLFPSNIYNDIFNAVNLENLGQKCAKISRH